MRVSRAVAALLAAFAVGGASCFSAPSSVEQSSSPIVGGQLDTTHDFVVELHDPTTGEICSGVLVAPTVVLTAAHCAFLLIPSQLDVLIGPDSQAPAQSVVASAVFTYPTYDSESDGLIGGIDLGVVYLSQPLSIAPAQVDTEANDEELAAADLTVIGFGRSDLEDPTQVGVRRSVDVSVQQTCTRLITFGDSTANACFGDSGGAVVANGKVVALVSSGNSDCSQPSRATRLSAHANWIAAAIAGRAGAPCPSCVGPDPTCDAPGETSMVTEPPDASSIDASAPLTFYPGGGGCAVAHARSTSEAHGCDWVLATLVVSILTVRRAMPGVPMVEKRSRRSSRRRAACARTHRRGRCRRGSSSDRDGSR